MTEQRDTQPWYKYFWPWFIIALLGSAVTASLYTVYLASSPAEPVLPEYQQQQRQ
ncbi:MAG: FixH family protein [Woeseiaceae bacterium]